MTYFFEIIYSFVNFTMKILPFIFCTYIVLYLNRNKIKEFIFELVARFAMWKAGTNLEISSYNSKAKIFTYYINGEKYELLVPYNRRSIPINVEVDGRKIAHPKGIPFLFDKNSTVFQNIILVPKET